MTRCGCNTYGFGPKTMCSAHSAQLRQKASDQLGFARRWFLIAEQYMKACKCNGACEICQEFDKAVVGG